MKITTFSNAHDFINFSAEKILSIKGSNIALSGGKTPLPVYENLSQKLDKKFLFQTDERYINKSSDDSNQKQIKNFLPQLIKFQTNLPISMCLEKYQELLPKIFDLCILGIGTDGHTASIFKDSKIISETKDLAAIDSQNLEIPKRITLKMTKIIESKNILVLLGADKKEILEKIIKSPEKYPAGKLLQHPNITIHLLSNPS